MAFVLERRGQETEPAAPGFTLERQENPSDAVTPGFTLETPRESKNGVRLEHADTSPRGNFQTLLDQFNRLGYGGVNLVQNAIRSSKQQDVFDPVGAFSRGASLQERPVFGDVLVQDLGFDEFLRTVGVEPSSGIGRAAIGTAGFAGDVLLDPMTYVPAGVLTKVAKGASDMLGVTKVASVIGNTPPVQVLGRQFIPGFDVRKTFPQVYEEAQHFDAIMKARQADVVEETLDLAKHFSKAEASVIRQYIEDPKAVTMPMTTAMTEAADTIRQKFQAFAEIEQQAGVLPNVRDFYFPHIRKTKIPPANLPPGGLKKIAPGFAKPRTIEDTIENVNHELAQEFFEENAFKGLGMRGLAHTRAITANEFLTKTLTEYGRRGKPGDLVGNLEGVYVARDLFRRMPTEFLAQHLPQLSKQDELLEIGTDVADQMLRNTKGAEVWVLPKEIANFLNTYRKTVTQSEDIKHFLGAYDKVLNLWKGYATGANFAFHGRNFISNYWLNYLRHGPTAFAPDANMRALGVLLSGSDDVAGKFPLFPSGLAKKTFTTATGQTYTYPQAFQMMKEYGVVNTGWLGTDIPMLIDRQLDLGLAGNIKKFLTGINPVSQHNFLLQTGRRLGKNVENHARAMSFLEGLRKGETPLISAMNTRKFLFNYDELTSFERSVMKRIVPFYTWMRKNIPLQFEQLLRDPKKYTALVKVEGEAERGIHQPEDMPDFIRSGVPIFASTDAEGRTMAYLLRDYVPATDIEKIIGGPTEMAGSRVPEIVRTALTSVSPILRDPVEQAHNYDLFFNRPIELYPGEPQTVLGQSVPRRLARLIPRPVGDISRLIGETGRSASPPAPVPERILRYFLGAKGYPVDEQETRRRKRFQYERNERQIKSSLKRALRQGDEHGQAAARRALEKLREAR